MKSNSKLYSFVVYITCMLIGIAIIRQIYFDISVFPFFAEEMSLYEPFPISDWLINYQGGFVRRGLAGEVLWQIYQLQPYSVILAIIGVCSTCLVIMTALCLWLFNRIGVSKWMLIFPMFLYFPYYGLYGGILGGRRDILILLLGLLLFWLYRKYTLASPKSLFGGGKIVGIWFLSVVILLLHEGMFFFFFPFLIAYTFLFYRPSVKSIFSRLLVLWWPVAFVMVAVVFCHGNDRVPEVIWQSWMPCFQAYPVSENNPPVGMGPACLSYSLRQNIGIALYYSFRSGFGGGLPSWPFTIYLLMGIYFLFTRMDMLLPTKNKTKLDHVQLSNVILLELFFALPRRTRIFPWLTSTDHARLHKQRY